MRPAPLRSCLPALLPPLVAAVLAAGCANRDPATGSAGIADSAATAASAASAPPAPASGPIAR